MNKVGGDFNYDIVFQNINNILKTNYIEFLHKDTLIKVISSIKFEEPKDIQTKIIRTLIRSKMFDKQDYELKVVYILLNKIKKRFPKMPIIIDGVALYLGKPFLELCD